MNMDKYTYMANKVNRDYPARPSLHGRRKIMSDETVVTRDNVADILEKAFPVHNRNRIEIEYLWKYYKGDQPILRREKTVRSEINHCIVENRANEIVAFKVGYLMGEPVQYVSTGNSENRSDDISRLNSFVFAEDKASKDKMLEDWSHICGVGYRIILPDAAADVSADDSPFEIYTLDPRYTFVVYSNTLGEPPLMGVKYVKKEDQTIVCSVYTKDRYFEIIDGKIVKEQSHILGDVPIIEYPLNQERMGCFEIVLDLLDALNLTASDRQNGLDQFIQALMIFHNVDIDDADFQALKDLGALKFKDVDQTMKGDIKYLTNDLNQAQTQTLVDHQYQTILEICGMPNRNGGSSTSDTGSAVIMRDGWSDAEARAKNTEEMFKVSEKIFLKIALRICRDIAGLELNLRDIEIRFTRRNYENILQKSQVLTTMLSNGKIHPRLAFEHCGLFVDPEQAYLASLPYIEQAAREEVKTDGEEADTGNGGENREGSVQPGQSGRVEDRAR